MDNTTAQFSGSRLAERRKELGLTQEQLAREVGLSEPYISQLEIGFRSPSVSTLIKLSGALDVSAGYLVGEDA